MSEGGDPACWADLAAGENGRFMIEHDLDAVDDAGGVVWSLPADGDLNVNLVRLDPLNRIDEHVNNEVDVLLVARAGSGELVVDGFRHPFGAATVALVPRGSIRRIESGTDGLTYLTVHIRRGPLTISRR